MKTKLTSTEKDQLDALIEDINNAIAEDFDHGDDMDEEDVSDDVEEDLKAFKTNAYNYLIAKLKEELKSI